mgnify:CR=1 FL=1
MARIEFALPDNFLFETEVDVRITDITDAGHLGNDRVLALIHEARARFFRHHGLAELNIDGRGIIVADAAVVYRAEAFFGDRLRIQMAGQDFNKYGCDLVFRITNVANGREIARAKTGIVFFDYTSRRIATAPARFCQLFPNCCGC